MNPANFPNVNGVMNAGAKPPGQMQGHNKNDNMQFILANVAHNLQGQGPFSGWRAEVSVRDRTYKVHQMITSLRLIQPQIELRNAAHAAMTFEAKAFREAASKADYDREFNDKLVHIRDTRVRQAQAMQGNMMQQGPATGMPGVGQSPFPQQMNRQMQASPMPGQQQMQMGLNDPNQQATMQQRQQQQQQQQQPQAMLQQQQRTQPRPGGAAALNDELNSLSPAEYENVCRVANQILQKTSPDDMSKIKVNLQNMSPEQKVYLSKKGMDPITYFFRVQALNQLRRFKRSRMEMARNSQTNGIDPANAMMGDPMMNQQRQQMFQNMVNMQQRGSPFPMAGQQGIDPSSFIGNVENIQGQQADGLRSQEAGQLVVPASSQMNQQFNPQNMLVGQQMGQVNINNAGISPQFLAQQHLPNAQPGVPDRSQQAAQLQPQSQPQAQTQAQRVQAAQKAQMAMSQSGQAPSHMQQQISQSPAMPMLNRPMAAPGQMSPAQAAAQVQPPSRQAGMGQLPANVQSMNTQPGMQGRPNIPTNLPAHVQEQLAQMSNEQLTAFFMNQRRMMANNQALARANPAQHNMALQQNLSQGNQGQQMANGQMGNGQNMRASMGSLGLQQQLAAMAGAQQANQMIPGQQMSAQQRQQLHQQQQLHRLQLLRQSGGPGMEMTPEQIREMDRVPFPPQIFANNPNAASIPKNIKTWGLLKELATTNPQLLGGTDLQKLVTLQKYHLAQILKETSNRNLEQNGQMPFMPPNFQRQQQPFMNPQQFQPGQQHAQFVMPQIRQITPQDLQVARQRLGAQVQNLTDDQLRDALRQRQMHAAQARAAQALASQQNQQSQAQAQPPVSAETAPIVKTEPVPQPPTQNQVSKPQAVTPAKATKAPAPKQTPPASKRKVQNEEAAAIQTSPVQSSNQPAASHGLPAAPTTKPALNLSNLSREQLAAMTPQQRAQIEAHIRRQQGQARGTVSRAAVEDAWNNLPERIRQQYNELAKNAPPEQPVAVTPEQRTVMNQQLRECTEYLGRMDTLVQFIAKIPNHDKNVRSLLGMRIQLMRQFKAGPDWTLNDQVTITPEYLAGTTSYIKKLFHHMIARVSQQQTQGPGQRPGATQAPNAQQANQNMAPLNASNLQQLQQQEEALQRARRASSQTAASGASAIPPAPFGAPSPHGVPHAYGPGSIPPPELKLPPPKKRKQSHPSTTPVSGPSGPKAQSKAAVDTKPIVGAFKCAVPECQYHYQGFVSQNDLDKHVEENHKAEEPIEDALEFALQSFGTLIKDEDKADAQGLTKGFGFTADLPTMVSNKTTAGTLLGKPDVKTEGVTPASGTTPMGRVSSQMAAKPASPASSQQSVKASGSSLKVTHDGKKEENRLNSMVMAAKDPWADSAISLEAIRDTFMDLTDDSGLGFGPMDEFLNAEMFTGTQDTPDSIETGVATQTPKDTEMPKNDEEGGKDVNSMEDSWIPMDWFCLPGRFEDGLLMNESCEDIDWEMVDFKPVEDNGMAIAAM